MAKPFSPANEHQPPKKRRKTGTIVTLLIVGGALGLALVFGPPMPTAEERALATAKQAAETAAAAAEKDAECRKDLKCTGNRFARQAESACRPIVERIAQFDFQWTTGFLEPKFSHFRWSGNDNKIVTYIGSKIKFQNAFGAWQHYRYECDFDVDAAMALGVRANPGQL